MTFWRPEVGRAYQGVRCESGCSSDGNSLSNHITNIRSGDPHCLLLGTTKYMRHKLVSIKTHNVYCTSCAVLATDYCPDKGDLLIKGVMKCPPSPLLLISLPCFYETKPWVP